jgi:hypothetical protein
MNLAEFRQKYPQYHDIPDGDLSRRLHEKYYADQPFDSFAQSIGYTAESEETPRASAPMPKEPSQVDVWLEKIKGMGQAFGVAPEPEPAAPDMEPMGTQAMAPAVDLRGLLPKDYGQREDGTAKGKGWMGEIPMQDGRSMTELSIGVNFDGKERLIPSIVPTLTKDELAHLSSGGDVTDSIVDKAVEHAKMRIQAGLSPFVDEKPTPDNPDVSGDPGTMQISPAEQLRSLLGTGEAAANLATVPMGLAVGGGRALFELAKGSDLKTISEEARKKAEEFTYTPKTEAGQQIAGAAMAPFEKLSEFDDALAQKVYDNTGNAFIAAMMGSAPELLLAGAPFISRMKLGRQGMAKGSITPEEMTAGMTEGQRLRNLAKEYGPDSPEFKAAFEESLGKRMGTQEPIAPDAPAAPVQAVPPVEPVVATPAVRSPEVAPVAAPAAVVPPVAAPADNVIPFPQKPAAPAPTPLEDIPLADLDKIPVADRLRAMFPDMPDAEVQAVAGDLQQTIDRGKMPSAAEDSPYPPDIRTAVDRVVTDLAPRVGVKIDTIDYSPERILIDPATPEGLQRAREVGIEEGEIQNAIESGEKFQIFGEHKLSGGEGGERRSTITLFQDATPEDVFHEFTHAVDEQGGLPGWRGHPEQRASFLAKEIQAGKETTYPELTREGTRVPAGQQKNAAAAQDRYQIGVYHGSPHKFDKISHEKIGTGEGAQAFGWGSYYSDLDAVAKNYLENEIEQGPKVDGRSAYEVWTELSDRNSAEGRAIGALGHNANVDVARDVLKEDSEALSVLDKMVEQRRVANSGNLYRAQLFPGKDPSEYTFLDWHEPLSKQPKAVELLKNVKASDFPEVKAIIDESIKKDVPGSELYKALATEDYVPGSHENQLGADDFSEEASKFLKSIGIDGNRYPTETLSGKGTKGGGAYNYVIFDENDVMLTSRESGGVVEDLNTHVAEPGSTVLKDKIQYSIRLFSESADVDYPPITKAVMESKPITAAMSSGWRQAAKKAGASPQAITTALEKLKNYNKIRTAGSFVMLPEVAPERVVIREGVLNTPAVEGQRRERLDKVYKGVDTGARSVEVGPLFEGGQERTDIPKEMRGLKPDVFLNVPITQGRLQRPKPLGMNYPLVVTGNPHIKNFKRPHASWDKSIKAVRIKPVSHGNAEVTQAVVSAIQYAKEVGAKILITSFRAKQPWVLASFTGIVPTDPANPEFAKYWKENPNPKPTDPRKFADWTPYVPKGEWVSDAFRKNGWDIEKNIYGTGGTWWWPKSRELDPAVLEAIGKTPVEYCDLMHKGCPSCRNCQKLTYPESAGAPIVGVTDEPFCEHGCPQCFVRLGQSGVGGRQGISIGQNAKQAGFGEKDLGDLYKNTINIMQKVARPAGVGRADYVSKFMRESPAGKVDMAISLYLDGKINAKELDVIRGEISDEYGDIIQQIPVPDKQYSIRRVAAEDKENRYIAESKFGTFTRNSKREYTHAVVRSDGWHTFSGSLALAEKEAQFQRRNIEKRGGMMKDLQVEVVPLSREGAEKTKPQTSVRRVPAEPTAAKETEKPKAVVPVGSAGNISVEKLKSVLQKRGVRGDTLLDKIDLYDDIISKGARVDENGLVTLYHRTTSNNAKRIVETGKMVSKEDRLFFGTKPTGQIEGYGEAVVEVKIPIEKLELNDVFTDEAHVTIKGTSANIKASLWPEVKTQASARRVKPPSDTEAMPAGNVQPQGQTQPTVHSAPIPKGQRRSETIKAVEKKLNLPIRFGKFRGPFAGIYKKKAEVVRLKKANDIGVAAHEVAHHVQDLIGLGGVMPPEVQAMAYAGAKNLDREGFSEFVRYYITDMPKVQREAPGFMATFDAALDQHPDVADAFTRIKESWNAWQAADPVQKIASIIRRGKDDKQRYTLNELYRDWVDELHPVQLLSEAIQKRSPAALDAIDNPYVMAWLTRGWARKAEQMLKYGTFQMDEAKGVKFTGKSLRDILKPIERAGEMEELDVYLVSKRAMNDPRILKGFEGVLPGENFVQAVERLEPKYGEIGKELYKFQDEVLTYLTESGRISQEMADSYRDQNAFYAPLYRVMDDAPPSGRIGAGKYSEIGNPAKRLKGSSRDILSPVENIIKNTFAFVNAAERNRVGQAILKATEVQGMGDMVERIPFPLEPQKILKEDFLRLLKQYGDVTAIRNVQITQTQTERALGQMGAQASPSTKLIKVAKEALEKRGFSPAEADQIIERIKAAPVGQARQDVIEKTVEKTVIMTIKEELGFGRMPDQVLHTFRPAYRAGPSEAIFYDDGKPVLVEMSKELASAVKGMDADGVNLLVRILALPAKVLRAGATITPEFAARNPIRDQMTAFVFSKYGYIPGWDLVRGIYHILKVDDLYKKYNASGAAQAALVSLDRNYLSLKLEEIQRMQTPGEAARHPLKTAKNLVIASAKNPLKVLQIFSELTEEASRVGGFTRALKTEGKDLEALLRAAVEGRDMTLDFSRVGAKSRAMNMITAFFNANIQGTNKMYRAFKDRPGQTFLKAFLGMTVPSLLLYYAQHDDPYYDEIPLWRKIIFWNIITHNADGSLNHIWSIPKPFEVGILFGTVPIMALEWMKTHDPKAFKEAMIAAGQALVPGVVPTAAIPMIENFANRSLFFDRPISPRGSEDLSPYLQYSERTSEAMKLAAKGLKDIPFLKDYANPAKMENVVRGYTGGMGGYALQEIDRILKATGAVTVAPAPAMKLEDLPLIKGFSQRWPTANAQSIEDFYEKYMEAKRKWADRQETVGINRARDVFSARGERLTLKSGEKVALGMPPELESMEGVAKMLTVLRNNAKVTKASQTATPDQKTEQLDRIYLAMTNLARKALGKQQLK